MRLIVALLLVALAIPVTAQSNFIEADDAGPRAALARLVALNSEHALDGREGQALLDGEMDDRAGASLGLLDGPERITMLADERAVARMRYRERRDVYLYLRRANGNWTIVAWRMMALPPFVVILRDGLRAEGTRSTEQDEMLDNLDLTTRTDAELHDWFGAHRSEIERLRNLVENGQSASGEAREIGRNLHILGANANTPELTTIVIGGILDNSVGFLHADDPGAVPAIDPDEYIWIEPVGGGWYLFRTT
jgi:hypothetical protein